MRRATPHTCPVGGAQTVGTDGTVRVNLPGDRLSRAADSCLALVAYQSDGKTVVARNYRLVRRKESGFAVIVK